MNKITLITISTLCCFGLHANDIESHLSSAYEALTQKDYQNAEKELTLALQTACESSSDKIQIYLKRANCFIYQKKYNEAIDDLNQLISGDLNNDQRKTLLLFRSVAYEKLGMIENALDDYRSYLDISKLYPDSEKDDLCDSIGADEILLLEKRIGLEK